MPALTAATSVDTGVIRTLAPSDSRRFFAQDIGSRSAGLGTDDLAVLAAAADRVSYGPGTTIIREGDPADRVFLLLRGSVSVRLDLGGGRSKRLATLNAGVAFGEMALRSGTARTASVVADEAVECAVIDIATIAEVAAQRPAIHTTLLANLGRLLASRLHRANKEIRMLEP